MQSLTSFITRHSRAFALSIFLTHASICLQAQPASGVSAGRDIWQVPLSHNLMPHFEQANGRKLLYVDGRPFTVLAVEIPWWDLIYGRYKETETAYDSLYPAAEKIGLNALKVPIKWSMVEPEKGVYDFSYIDHAKSMAEKHHLKVVLNWFGHYASGDGTIYGNLTGELYAPMYIVSDEKTYPRAVDGDGVIHHNAASYDYEPIIGREIAAFRAFMQHIKQVDSQTHTILMIQVENEIAVFGVDRKNPKMWRDHSPATSKRFADNGFTDDLKFSAWDLSYHWIRRITEAGAEVYPIPFFHNYVGGEIADWMVGGAPGEDVQTYLQNCPHISFIGVNSYFCAEWRPDYSCGLESEATVTELREPLFRYRVGRNLPAITEINSGLTPITYKLKVFMSRSPGQRFSTTETVNGFPVTVTGENNGQAIVIHPAAHEFLLVGYRTNVSFTDPAFQWPMMKQIRVERLYWAGDHWNPDGEPNYGVDQSKKTLDIDLDTPQAVLVSW